MGSLGQPVAFLSLVGAGAGLGGALDGTRTTIAMIFALQSLFFMGPSLISC